MAQPYPYQYKGVQRTKQDKCLAAMPLDKARIWLDFNECCAVDQESGAPLYLFSQADIVNDSEGTDVELYEGMEVSVFDEDLDPLGKPDALLAEGVLVRNTGKHHPAVKWLIRLSKNRIPYQSGADYVYWMSDLRYFRRGRGKPDSVPVEEASGPAGWE